MVSFQARWTGLFYAIIFSLLTSGVAFAQTELTVDLVESRLSALRDSGAAEDSNLFIVYSEAKMLLQEALLHESEAAADIDTMKSAAKLENQIHVRIEAFVDSSVSPEDYSSLPKEQLEGRLIAARSDKVDIRDSVDSYNRRLAARESNADRYRTRLTEIRLEQEAMHSAEPLVSEVGAPSLAEANTWRLLAVNRALSTERRALGARLDSQPARYGILAAERSEAEIKLEHLAQLVEALERQLHKIILEELNVDFLGMDDSSPLYELANDLMGDNRALKEELIEIRQQIANTRAGISDLERRARELKRRSATAKRVVDYAVESEAVGKMLLGYWEDLGSVKIFDNVGGSSRDAARAVVRRVKLEELLRELSNATAYLNEKMGEYEIDGGVVQRRELSALHDIVRDYKRQIRTNIGQQSRLIAALDSLKERQQTVDELTRTYESFLQSRILWIPAYPALWEINIGTLNAEVESIRAYAKSFRITLTLPYVLGFLVLFLLYLRRDYFKTRQQEFNQRVLRPRDDDIGHTISALSFLLLRAISVPGMLAFIGMAIEPEPVSRTLLSVAFGLFLARAYLLICERDGLGERHFKWSRESCSVAYRNVSLLIRIWLPLIVLARPFYQATIEGDDALLVRVVVLILVALPGVHIVLNLTDSARKAQDGSTRERGLQLQLFLVFVSIGFFIAVFQGHLYSVTVIFRCLAYSLAVVTLLMIVQAVLMRWIRVTRRRLRMEQLKFAMAGARGPSRSEVEEKTASVANVSEDTAEFVNAGLLIIVALALYHIWSPLLPAFDVLKETILWTSTSTVEGEAVETQISLGILLVVALMASVTIYLARKLPAFMDLLLRSKTDMTTSDRYTVSTLLNYSIVGVGLVAALSALGLQWDQLQWLIAALGVGIGFGLQEIIANFISGLIILFERPIRIGDIISTGDKDGIVTRIRIRATTIRDWDGKELLVPNKEFITGRLLNWSLSDPKVRIILPVGIAYGSDVEIALRTLADIVEQHPRVVSAPEPQIIFESFGDNALMLSARVYLTSAENRALVITELNREIYRRFDEQGIRIAFPQRDVHLDSEAPLHVVLDASQDGKNTT